MADGNGKGSQTPQAPTPKPARKRGNGNGHGHHRKRPSAQYEMRDDGLYALIEHRHGNEPIWLAGFFEVLGLTIDAAGDDWGLLLRWRDPDRVLHKGIVPMTLLLRRDGQAFMGLMSGGLRVHPGGRQLTLLKDYFLNLQPLGRAVVTGRCGWFDMHGQRVFVLPDAVLGSGADAVYYTGERSGFHCAGSLPEWQEEIAAPATGNARLIFAICVPFTAPLLDIVDEPSGGFHLRGGSSSGKTTTLVVAASVGGAEIGTWRVTANGLEAQCAVHSDGCLLLDEISMADPRLVADSAYLAINGIGRSRMTAERRAEVRARWRLLLLSSGETSLADRLNEKDSAALAGRDVRIIDLPADAGNDLGVFDHLPEGYASAGAFADDLRIAAGRQRGHALRAFLDRLIGHPDVAALRHRIERERADWIKQHVAANADGQVKRVAARFGLIAAAGRLAIEFAIMPSWHPQNDVDWAVNIMFADWLDARGGHGAGEPMIVRDRLAEIIARHGASRFSRLDDDDKDRVLDRLGYWRMVLERAEDGSDRERRQFLFPTSIWRREVLRGLDARIVHRGLIEASILKADSRGWGSILVKRSGQARRMYAVYEDVLEDGRDDGSHDGDDDGE